MDRTIFAKTEATPERLHAIVAELTTYPDWLALVNKVEADKPAESDEGPAYVVTLRAKVGPFARNKRLRMVRTEVDAPHFVRFARAELDGRNHSSWVMQSEVEPSDDGGSNVAVRLVYEGQLWDTLLEGVLDSAVSDAVTRLATYATTSK